MKCEDFLPSLETGRWWQRLAARRHAARCPNCAAVRRHFAAAMQELAEPTELSPELKALWCEAAVDDPSTAGEPPTPAAPHTATIKQRKRWPVALAVAASIAAMITLALLLGPEEGQEGTADTESPREVDTSQEFARLESSVALLDVELEQVEQEIELMRARQLAADLLRRHGKP